MFNCLICFGCWVLEKFGGGVLLEAAVASAYEYFDLVPDARVVGLGAG